MTLKELYTSFDGRIGRQQFWLGSLTLVVIVSLFGSAIVMLFGTRLPPQVAPADRLWGHSVEYSLNPVGAMLMLVVGVFYLWGLLAVAIKRWHDRDKSGWWVLLPMIPFIGAIWALVETGFLKGSTGPNRFGDDPLAR